MLFTQVGYYAIILILIVFLVIIKRLHDRRNKENKFAGLRVASKNLDKFSAVDPTQAGEKGSKTTSTIDENKINELISKYRK